MGQETLPSYVVAANKQRDLYYNEKKIKNARELVAASGFESVVEAQNRQLADFLSGRNIQHDSTLEQLVKIQEPQVALLGATFYFSRKFFATSHDCGEDVQNPVPLMQNVFDALAASDDRHAVKVLDELSDISSKHSSNQRKVVAIAADILPELIRDYRAALVSLEQKHKVGSAAYNIEKAQIDHRQMALLDKVAAYAKQTIRTYQKPSLNGFRKHAGLNGDAEVKYSKVLSVEYIGWLSRAYGTNHRAAIATLESEIGQLQIIKYDHNSSSERKFLTVVAGPESKPRTNHLNYSRKDDECQQVKPLILAMMDHIIGNPLLPVGHRNATSTTRPNVERYF